MTKKDYVHVLSYMIFLFPPDGEHKIIAGGSCSGPLPEITGNSRVFDIYIHGLF